MKWKFVIASFGFLFLSIGCSKREIEKCSFDRDCGTGYYCNLDVDTCFLVPEVGAPTFDQSAPATPSNNLQPVLNGRTEANATVYLFKNADCSGPALQTVVSTETGAFSFQVSVAENQSETFYASAEKVESHPSACSTGFTYVNDRVAPTVSSTLPADGATDAPRKNGVTVTFSEPMAAASLTPTSLSVSSPSGAVPGTVTVEGAVARFVPQAHFSPLTEYQVSLTSGAADMAGNPVAPLSFHFITPNIDWSAGQALDSGAEGDQRPESIAVTAEGVVFVLWNELADDGQTLWALRRSSPEAGTPVKLSSSTSAIRNAKVMVDGGGNALAAWAEGNDAKAIRYVQGTGWEAQATTLSTASAGSPVASSFSSPVLDVALNANGAGAVAWCAKRLWVRAFTLAGGWAPAPEEVSTSNNQAEQPQIGVTPEGTLLTIWSEYDSGAQNATVFARQRVGTEWQAAPVTLEAGARFPLLRLAGGHAMAVWRTSASGPLHSKRYVAGQGWDAQAAKVSDGSRDGEYSFALGSGGDALMAWIALGEVFSNVYQPAAGWGEPQRIAPNETESAYTAAAVDAAGNGFVFWAQQSPDSEFDSWFLWANRYSADGGWTGSQKLTQKERAFRFFYPHASFDAAGNAAAAYSWGSEFEGDIFLARWNVTAD